MLSLLCSVVFYSCSNTRLCNNLPLFLSLVLECVFILGSKSKDPYSSKGPSLERSSYKQSYNDGRGSRSGSQHRSADRESSLPPTQKLPQAPPKVVQAQGPAFTMSEEQLERHVKNNLDEYLNDSCTVEEYSQDTQSTVPPSYFPKMVTDG